MHEPQHQMVNTPHHGKNQKHTDKSEHAKHYILKLHNTCVRDPLTNLYGKGDDNYQGKHIYPANHHDMTMLYQPFKNRVHYKYHHHSHSANYKEM